MKSAAVAFSLTCLGTLTAGAAFSAGESNATLLSNKTVEQLNSAWQVYQRCINAETLRHLEDSADSRAVTDLILKGCEDKLAPMKKAFEAEGVPADVADRYVRRKRGRAAQEVIRAVMGAQAGRAAEAAAADPTPAK